MTFQCNENLLADYVRASYPGQVVMAIDAELARNYSENLFDEIASVLKMSETERHNIEQADWAILPLESMSEAKEILEALGGNDFVAFVFEDGTLRYNKNILNGTV